MRRTRLPSAILSAIRSSAVLATAILAGLGGSFLLAAQTSELPDEDTLWQQATLY